ncbi:MAG: sigma-70 family RNA polymerase sigma factor [Elusimicrobia bacterium]|nr:sigma-70 family RNA polymerase sigma factor [Elusimicrobiota bacterium]
MAGKKQKNVDHNGIEEKQLFRSFRKGDEEAKNRIIQKYSDWVLNIAKKFHSLFHNIGLDELIAEGNRGILDAMKRYDTARKVKFSTYAWFWILKNIREYITSELAIVDLPQSTLTEFKRISESLSEEAKKGKSPTLEIIAKQLKMDINDVREIVSDKMNLFNVISLDKLLDEEDETQRLGDLVEDKKEKKIQEILDIQDDKTDIGKLLKHLSPIERKVIQLRFGFTDNGSRSLKEVGGKLRIPAAKVKDIESVSVRKLKKLLGDRTEKAY